MRDRRVKFEFPYDKSCFKDRYTRQSRNAPCSTIVAHLSKDGLMFIHPTQTRSFTPREAARVQSFPDWFVFPESRTSSFNLIGNAVPPLVAESVAEAVLRFLGGLKKMNGVSLTAVERRRIAKRVVAFASMSRGQLRAVEKNAFVQAWNEFLCLFSELHPANALDHGTDRIAGIDLADLFPTLNGSSCRRYKRSGWPVAFSLFGNEAWRRKREDQLTNAEFYNVIHTAASASASRGIDERE
jgi:DNA (cytosine-5)-methyltransferase 1